MINLASFDFAQNPPLSVMQQYRRHPGLNRSCRSRSRGTGGVLSVLLALIGAFGSLASASEAPSLRGGNNTVIAAPSRSTHVDKSRDSMLGCNPSVVVTNANDAGSGSLRQAVLNVCASGTITFAQRFQIQLASEIVVDKPLSVDAISVSSAQAVLDDALLQIKGSTDHRIFRVNASGELTLLRVRLSNGVLNGAELGGAIINSGVLRISECRFDGNRSGPQSSLGGGAILNGVSASLYVEGGTFDANISQRGAAIFNSGDAELYNSTFSNNRNDNGTSVSEGAIQNRGTLFAAHITVTNNGNGGTAGGLFAFNADTTLVNSIFAGNTGDDCQIAGGTFSSVALLRQTGNCARDVDGDPLLGSLTGNGGVTATHALGAGSAAFGIGDSAFCLSRDQRGLSRAQSGGCDLGAVQESIFAGGFE